TRTSRARPSAAKSAGTSWTTSSARSHERNGAMLKRSCLAGCVLVAVSCGGDTVTVTAPSTPASAPTAPTFSLSGTVTGNVYTGAVAVAVDRATVSIVDGPNAGRSTETDPAGKYVFSGLQQSGFTVRISATGYVSVTRAVTLTTHQTLDVLLTPAPASIVLTGRVIDAGTLAPIAGAAVSINGRSWATTDSSGAYTVTGFLDMGGNSDVTYVSAQGYDADYHFIQGTTQNVRLFRSERITAGESTRVTVTPQDTVCVNDIQDEPGLGPAYVCRSVHVIAPIDGVMTLEAVPTADALHPTMEVQATDVTPCCTERLANPASIDVKAGTDVLANVEIPASSTTTQSFTLRTSMSPR
ncbi:MAG TPA: carboxypeptidase regulatory-like domain-containing protein, partial [Rhodanobacteraceae bacterium]